MDVRLLRVNVLSAELKCLELEVSKMKFGKFKVAKVKGLKQVKGCKQASCKVGSSTPTTTKADSYGTQAKKRIENFNKKFK